jgi:hypothetical protein
MAFLLFLILKQFEIFGIPRTLDAEFMQQRNSQAALGRRQRRAQDDCSRGFIVLPNVNVLLNRETLLNAMDHPVS